MHPTLERLIQIVRPPEEPVEIGDDTAFAAVEQQLGLSLPRDYKEYIATYGSGRWHVFWWILNPFSENEHLNLLVQSQNRRPKKWSALDAERAVRESEKKYPHAIYPESGGLLPWAITDNGGRMFWLTAGEPSGWKTVYYASRDPNFEVHDLPCMAILLGIVNGELPLFAEEFADHEAVHGTAYYFSGPNAFVPIKLKRKRQPK
jgi:hypothetical protein